MDFPRCLQGVVSRHSIPFFSPNEMNGSGFLRLIYGRAQSRTDSRLQESHSQHPGITAPALRLSGLRIADKSRGELWMGFLPPGHPKRGLAALLLNLRREARNPAVSGLKK
jgi:hypothetical protein